MIGSRYGLHQIGDALSAMENLEEIKPVIDPSLTPTD
jgi:hypothetical protein